ncbi:winged-helix domain-containing protein [Altererythrobacter sp. MF3-039]|uniref:winged helix-turn-helix transcriptional regulator n=1 Tax=Altererythrobacter sp. MF3-039 TaxID=3252901 RepID=UPI00390C6A87
MTQFEWLSLMDDPPARWDLRYLGWNLIAPRISGAATSSAARESIAGRARPIIIDWRAASRSDAWVNIADKRWALAIGVDDSTDRAALLEQGIGEALPTNVALVELATRALRLGENAQAMRRFRRAGPVVMDLFHRDGRIGEQWLGLHPREFALVWRLADAPGERVTRRELLADVWRLDHDPETNSVEVHISRLRSKLSISQAGWLIETDPEGGYRLAVREIGQSEIEQALDSNDALGNDEGQPEFGEDDGTAAQRTGLDRTG